MTMSAPYSLQGLASSAGVACVLALDHRDAMRNVYARAGVEDASEGAILATKRRIVDALAGSASAVMLDPAAVDSCRPARIGLVVPLEEQGYERLAAGRLTRLTESFGPADAAALGATACKLLLYYRADHAKSAARQRGLLEEAAASCHRHGLPLVVEPLVYRLEAEDEDDYARNFGELVVSAARDLAGLGPDLLKLQFPGDAVSCERATDAASSLPWTLLGGSDVEGDAFARQLRIACQGGASGFMAGRAIWGDAIGLHDGEQREWLRAVVLPLFDRLSDIAHTYARSIG
jgi:tagatose-1,6-bisphosphate aldolase